MQAHEDLDLPRLKTFLDRVLHSGVHGIFVLGTISEFYAPDESEKQQVIATAVEHVRKRVPVYAGTGAESTREAVRLTKLAEREGADGVSVITPYFVSPSQQEIYDHYRRIAESTALPVILYNNPSTCGGTKIDVDTVSRLAEIPNILGIKDSSGDLQNTLEYIRVVPERFAPFAEGGFPTSSGKCEFYSAALEKQARAVPLKRGVERAVEMVVEEVKKMSSKVENNERIAQVGTMSRVASFSSRPG